MKIAIASDHTGYDLKESIKKHLDFKGIEYEDLGSYTKESVDYPDYAIKVVEALNNGYDRGILICGTGIGMSVVANKFPNIRAALCSDVEVAKQSREHVDANVLVLSSKLDNIIANETVDVWLSTPFSNEERHVRRLAKISQIEKRLLK